MKKIDLIFTANNNLKQSKLRTLLTVGAIFVGAFFLTFTMAFSRGARAFVRAQLEGFDMPNTFIISKFPELDLGSVFTTDLKEYSEDKQAFTNFEIIPITDKDKEEILAIDGVKEVNSDYVVNIKYVEIEGKKYTSTNNVFYPNMEFPISAGKLTNISENKIAVGNAYAKALNQKPEDLIGKKFQIAFKTTNPDDSTFNQEVEIVAVLQDSIILNTVALISDTLAKKAINEYYLGNDSLYADIQNYVTLDENLSQDRVEEIKKDLEKKKFSVSTIEEQTSTFDSLIDAVQISLLIFSLIILFVSIFAIANTLYMSVYERTREIGLMKALGMKDSEVFNLFAFESAIIGFWGSIMGIIIATIFGYSLNIFLDAYILSGTFESFKAFEFPTTEVLITIPGIMFVAFLAGTLPANKASKLNPIEALKYD